MNQPHIPDMAWIEHDYPDTAALAEGLRAALQAACEEAIRERGEAFLSLAGGRTPFPAYRALAASTDIDWSNVVVMPGDDRCVPHDHPASNVAALRDAFAAASGVRVEALTAADGDATASLTQARAMLLQHATPFDAVVLGMGEDGHTASLFPHALGLTEAMADDANEDAFALTPDPLPPEAPFSRITLGYARLRRARGLHLLVTGARKREVLRAAQTEVDARAWISMPISAFLHAPAADGDGIPNRVLHIHWSP
jgi:6-phosphogluconolactonase